MSELFRFRPHRGSFADSMAEIATFKSAEELQAAIGPDVVLVGCEPSIRDDRPGWQADTWCVMARYVDGVVGVCGMSDKPICMASKS